MYQRKRLSLMKKYAREWALLLDRHCRGRVLVDVIPFVGSEYDLDSRTPEDVLRQLISERGLSEIEAAYRDGKVDISLTWYSAIGEPFLPKDEIALHVFVVLQAWEQK